MVDSDRCTEFVGPIGMCRFEFRENIRLVCAGSGYRHQTRAISVLAVLSNYVLSTNCTVPALSTYLLTY